MTASEKRELLKMLEASQRVRLSDLRLVSTQSRIGQIKPDELPTSIQQAIRHGIQVRDDGKAAQIVIAFRLFLYYESDGPEKPAIAIAASYGAMFDLVKPIRPRMFHDIVIAHVATMTAYPFWRELVHATTVRMGFPPLTMPLLHPAALLKDLKDNPPLPPKKAEKKDKGGS